MKIFINWVSFLLIIAAIVVIWHHRALGIPLPSLPERGTMTGPQVIIFALSFAFTWVEVLKWGNVKPFNCLKCMCGWSAVILAFTFHVHFWYMYVFVGLFVGAMFEGIKMRWL